MAFPQTRLTLVQRLAAAGSADDWRAFLNDYWGPLCRFAMRWGSVGLDEAEDVASEVLELVWQKRLLDQWLSARSAKLRTLLCAVARNNLSNRARVRAGRQRILEEIAHDASGEDSGPIADAFYAAWVDDLVQRAVSALAADYGREGRGDYVRVLYGRLCQGLTIAACADALRLKPATVDNYYRHASDRLAEQLRDVLRRHVANHAAPEAVEEEFAAEWSQLGDYLTARGGLEEALRQANGALDSLEADRRRTAALSHALGHWKR